MRSVSGSCASGTPRVGASTQRSASKNFPVQHWAESNALQDAAGRLLRVRLETMSNFWRRLRGDVGIPVTWGALWAAIGVVLTLAVGILWPEEIDPGEGPGKV